MPLLLDRDRITSLLQQLDPVSTQREAFLAYSRGEAVIPPVGELLFTDPPGDVHIKYGYLKNGSSYVIKIASGFYENPKRGLASSQGMMLLFDQQTGIPQAILMDEGLLTDTRTAAAGALVARYFAPKGQVPIGILGTGIQARMQLDFLLKDRPDSTVWVWGRSPENARRFRDNLPSDIAVNLATTPAEVAQNARLIVTTTPAKQALLRADDIQPGTHLTAVGSDTAGKRELHGSILQMADRVIVDSLSQSKSRGEVYRAVQDGLLASQQAIELGQALADANLQRTTEKQITVVDLTGVAVQDLAIANAVYEATKP